MFFKQPSPSLTESSTPLEGVHTPEHPYCGDLTCWCHTSIPCHAWQENTLDRVHSEEEQEQARSFFGIGKKRG